MARKPRSDATPVKNPPKPASDEPKKLTAAQKKGLAYHARSFAYLHNINPDTGEAEVHYSPSELRLRRALVTRLHGRGEVSKRILNRDNESMATPGFGAVAYTDTGRLNQALLQLFERGYGKWGTLTGDEDLYITYMPIANYILRTNGTPNPSSFAVYRAGVAVREVVRSAVKSSGARGVIDSLHRQYIGGGINFRLTLMIMYGYRCVYCDRDLMGKSIGEMQTDHVIAKSLAEGGNAGTAGLNSIHNLVPSCKQCNNNKSDGTFFAIRSGSGVVKKSDVYKMILDDVRSGKIPLNAGEPVPKNMTAQTILNQRLTPLRDLEVYYMTPDPLTKDQPDKRTVEFFKTKRRHTPEVAAKIANETLKYYGTILDVWPTPIESFDRTVVNELSSGMPEEEVRRTIESWGAAYWKKSKSLHYTNRNVDVVSGQEFSAAVDGFTKAVKGDFEEMKKAMEAEVRRINSEIRRRQKKGPSNKEVNKVRGQELRGRVMRSRDPSDVPPGVKIFHV